MDKIVDTLAKTPLPTILVVAGIVFLFLAIGGQLGARFSTERLKPIYATAIGLILLGLGIWLQFAQGKSTPATTATPTPTPASASSTGQPATYALRGPAVKGTVTRRVYKFDVPDVGVTIEEGGGYKTGSMKFLNQSTSRTEVVAVEEGRPIVLRQTVEADDRNGTLTLDGQEHGAPKKGPLLGTSVLMERKNGQWVKTLEGHEPNEEQKAELQQPFVGSEELYPVEKIAPGYTWELKDQQLVSLYPNTLEVTGNAWCKFERVENHAGEQCAVISRQSRVTYKKLVGKRPTEYKEGSNSITYRSLKSFLDLETTLDGNLAIKTDFVIDGKKQSVEMAGPFRTVSYVTDVTNEH